MIQDAQKNENKRNVWGQLKHNVQVFMGTEIREHEEEKGDIETTQKTPKTLKASHLRIKDKRVEEERLRDELFQNYQSGKKTKSKKVNDLQLEQDDKID